MKTSAMWTLSKTPSTKSPAMSTLWYCIPVDVYDPVQVLSLTCLSICSFKVLSTLPQPLCGMDVVPIILPENTAEGTDIDVLRSFLEDEQPPLILEHDGDDQPPLEDAPPPADEDPPYLDVPRSSLEAERHEAEHQSWGSIHLHMLWTQQDGRYIRNQISGDEKPEQS